MRLRFRPFHEVFCLFGELFREIGSVDVISRLDGRNIVLHYRSQSRYPLGSGDHDAKSDLYLDLSASVHPGVDVGTVGRWIPAKRNMVGCADLSVHMSAKGRI
jgi:hypothetical protein